MAFNNNFHPTATPTPALQVFRPPPPHPQQQQRKEKLAIFCRFFFVYILFSFNIDKAPREKKSEVGGVVLKKEQQRKMVKFSLT